MEPMQRKTTGSGLHEEDIDLDNFFNKTGGLVRRFFIWIANVFSLFGMIILNLLFFIKRNLAWIFLGALIGMGYGALLYSKNGSKYYSDMTVRTNFNSQRSLYGAIDFFNALINNNNYSELSRILKISPADASSLVAFEASPVESEIITSEIYRDQFLNVARNEKIRTDTFWMNAIKYKDFKTALTKFDYPLHEISVISTNASVFPKIQEGIIDRINENELLRQSMASELETIKSEEYMLSSSIQSLDSLKTAYVKRLSNSAKNDSGNGNTLTLMEGSPALLPPELELYNKLLDLKNEWRLSRKQSVLQSRVLLVYSPFGAAGQKVSFFRQSIVKYALTGLTISLVILFGIAFYRLLGKLEKKYSPEKLKKGRPPLA